MRGNGRSFTQDKTNIKLDDEARESAIRALDLRNCLERYGVTFNAQGFAHCPFHSERTASFKVRGRFWHCFGCNESGELVKFVRKKFGLSYPAALNAICEDFRITTTAPTLADIERLDRLYVERLNCVKRYKSLLDDLDAYTSLYWLAYDIVEYTAQYCGGKTIDNDQYVSAQYALLAAQKALEQAEYDCAQFIKDNPQALQKPSEKPKIHNKVILPPAPKWDNAAPYGDSIPF